MYLAILLLPILSAAVNAQPLDSQTTDATETISPYPLYPLPTSSPAAHDSDQPSTSEPCTKTITNTRFFGCLVTTAGQTTTKTIDCNGCVLSTRLAAAPVHLGVVCIGGIKTVTIEDATATVTACASGS